VDRTNEKYQENFLGSGWAFPVTFFAGNYQLQTTAYEQNINNNIAIILQTRKGERCLEPGFGLGVQQFFFQNMDNALRGEISDAVRIALLNNEPRITVLNVEVEYTDLLSGLIEIRIAYEYNQTNTRHNYVYPFYIREGTNLAR
jgi:phage baseplate assembly protein W